MFLNFSGGIFFVEIALILAGLALPIWALIDAAMRPDWAWQRAGENKGVYMALLVGSMVVGLFCCGLLSIGMSLVYFLGVRPKVRNIEKGGPGLASGYPGYPGFDPYRSAMYGPGSYTPEGYDEFGVPLGPGVPGGGGPAGPGGGPVPPAGYGPPPVYGPGPVAGGPPPVYGPGPSQPFPPVPPVPGAGAFPAPPASPTRWDAPPGTPGVGPTPPAPTWNEPTGATWAPAPGQGPTMPVPPQPEPPVEAYQLPPGTGPVFEPTPSPTDAPTFIPAPPWPGAVPPPPAPDTVPAGPPSAGESSEPGWHPPDWEPSVTWTPPDVAPPVEPPVEPPSGVEPEPPAVPESVFEEADAPTVALPDAVEPTQPIPPTETPDKPDHEGPGA